MPISINEHFQTECNFFGVFFVVMLVVFSAFSKTWLKEIPELKESKTKNSPLTVSLAGLLFLLMFSNGLCVTQT